MTRKRKKSRQADIKKTRRVQKSPKKVKLTPPAAPYLTFGKDQWVNSIIFIVLSFALYFGTLSYGYILDDTIVIVDNAFTKKGFGGLVDIFSTESFAGYFGEQKNLVQGARYRPLSIATFALEYQFFGMNAGISHFFNILLYGITGITLYYLLHTLYQSKSSHRFWNIALVASLIYIVHPIHTEAVANIKGRDEIMTMMLSILSLIGILKWDQYNKLKYGVIAGVLFFLGLLAKENAITFCAIVPAVMYVFRKKSIAQSLKFSIPIFIAAAVYIGIRYAIIGYLLNSESQITDLMNNPFVGMSGNEKYATIFYTLWKYLSLSFYPHPLAHDYYPYAIPILNWASMKAFLPAVFYLGLFVASIVFFFRRSASWFGIIFYLVTLTIVSNLFVNVGTFMNERFLFMASAGICMLISVFLVKFLGNLKFRFSSHLGIGLFALMAVGFSYKTITRIPDWKDPISLNRSAVKVNPGSARANSFMSTALFNAWKDQPYSEDREQQLLLAGYYAKQAAKIIPMYKNANLMRAGIAAELYKYDQDVPKLLATFKEVIDQRPDIDYVTQYLQYLNNNLPSRELEDFYFEVGYDLLLTKKRNPNFAVKYLLLGYDHYPQSTKILRALVEAYQRLGNSTEANKYQNMLDG